MIPACGKTDKYTGKKQPTCNDGEGCAACYQKHAKYLDASRPKMSRDFKEFYDYVCAYKRVLQKARLGKDDLTLSQYESLAWLEKTIRTGEYRHHFVVAQGLLADMGDGRPRKTAKPKGR